MRLINLVFGLFIAIFAIACNGNTEPKTAEASKAETPVAKENPLDKIKKAPVTIVPSGAQDYPEVVKDLGFPIHPDGEVANVGNALIEDGGLFMRLNIKDKIEHLPAFFDKGMADNGWSKVDMKIYQGADKAMRYEKDGVVSRIIMIDEDYYTKVAVNMTKKVDPADFEDR